MNHLRLPGGREFAYCEYGRLERTPVFFFHGWPGSRLDFAANGGGAAATDARVMAVDRPGIGGSDPQPNRKVLDWPVDIAALADALELQQLAVPSDRGRPALKLRQSAFGVGGEGWNAPSRDRGTLLDLALQLDHLRPGLGVGMAVHALTQLAPVLIEAGRHPSFVEPI